MKINPVREYVDTGFAFTPFFSPLFLSLVLILALMLLAVLILYIQGQKNTPLQTLIFSIISFSLLKNIFDGGLFHIEAILSISALLIVLKNNSHYQRKDQQTNILFFFIHLLIGLTLATVTSSYLPLHGNNFSIEFAKKFSFFLALIVLYYKKQIKNSVVLISVTPILSILFFVCLSMGMYGYENEQTILLPSQEIITYSTSSVEHFFPVDVSANFSGAVISSGHVSKDTVKSQLMQKLGTDRSFNTLDIPDITCDKAITNMRNFETRLSNTEISITERLFSLSKRGHEVVLRENDCAYVNPSILNALFASQGIASIILIQHD